MRKLDHLEYQLRQKAYLQFVQQLAEDERKKDHELKTEEDKKQIEKTLKS
jgi:hypothetical protein